MEVVPTNFRLSNDEYSRKKMREQVIFIRPLGRGRGATSAADHRGRFLSAPLAASTSYKGPGLRRGANSKNSMPQFEPPRKCSRYNVHMLDNRSYRARGISEYIPTICNSRGRDLRAPNTLVCSLAPLAASVTYSLPRRMGKWEEGAGVSG